jgi:hypothetical protein
LEIFEHSISMWDLKLKFSSSSIPRSLKLFSLLYLQGLVPKDWASIA